LAKVAAEQGIVGFTADVLAENHSMLATFRKIAAQQEVQSDANIARVRFRLKELKPERHSKGP
jgi:hypothetical protein